MSPHLFHWSFLIWAPSLYTGGLLVKCIKTLKTLKTLKSLKTLKTYQRIQFVWQLSSKHLSATRLDLDCNIMFLLDNCVPKHDWSSRSSYSKTLITARFNRAQWKQVLCTTQFNIECRSSQQGVTKNCMATLQIGT